MDDDEEILALSDPEDEDLIEADSYKIAPRIASTSEFQGDLDSSDTALEISWKVDKRTLHLQEELRKLQEELRIEKESRTLAEASRDAAEKGRREVEESKAAAFTKIRVLAKEAVKQRDDAIRQRQEASDAAESLLRELDEVKKAQKVYLEASLSTLNELRAILNKIPSDKSYVDPDYPSADEKNPAMVASVAATLVRETLRASVEGLLTGQKTLSQQLEQQSIQTAVSMSALEASLQLVRQELDAKSKELSQWQQALASKEVRIREVTVALDEAEGRTKRALQEIEAERELKEEAEGRVRGLEVEVARLRESAEEHRRAAGEARERARVKSEEVKEAEKEREKAEEGKLKAEQRAEQAERMKEEAEGRRLEAGAEAIRATEEGKLLLQAQEVGIEVNGEAVDDHSARGIILLGTDRVGQSQMGQDTRAGGEFQGQQQGLPPPSPAPPPLSPPLGLQSGLPGGSLEELEKLRTELLAHKEEVLRRGGGGVGGAAVGDSADAVERAHHVRELEEVRSVAASEAAALRGQIAELEARLSEAETQASLLSTKFKILEEEYAGKVAELEEDAARQESQLREEVALLEEESARWRAAAREEAAAGKEAEEEAGEMSRQNSQLSKELSQWKQSAHDALARIAAKEELAAAAMEARDAAEAALRIADKRVSEAREEVEELERRMEEAERRGGRLGDSRSSTDGTSRGGCLGALRYVLATEPWHEIMAGLQRRHASGTDRDTMDGSSEMEQLMRPLV